MDTSAPGFFELLGTYAAQMTVASRWIVERVNVIGYLGVRDVAGSVAFLLYVLFLEAAEEGFSHRIVPTVASTTHARLKVISLAEPTPVVAAVSLDRNE